MQVRNIRRIYFILVIQLTNQIADEAFRLIVLDRSRYLKPYISHIIFLNFRCGYSGDIFCRQTSDWNNRKQAIGAAVGYP